MPPHFYFYDMETEEAQPLTYFQDEGLGYFSISPDGRYIVFEKWVHIDSISYRRDLWIMDRLNPVEMWPITDSGNCSNPSWSGADVPGYDGDGDEDAGKDGEGDNGSSGGGGGCFLYSIRIHP